MPKLAIPGVLRFAPLLFALMSGAAALCRPAHAQVTPLSTWVDGKFPITIRSPTTQSSGGRIDCAPRTPGCRPLNLSRCTDSTPMPISFIVAPGAQGLPTYTGSGSQVLYAFLGNVNGCVYSTIAGQTGFNPNMLIGSNTSLAGSAPFFAGGTQSFVFPDGLANFSDQLPGLAASKIYTVGDMLQTLGVCNGSGVQMSTYYLCMGVDASGSRGINNGGGTQTANNAGGAQNTGSDPVTYLQFQVDTVPPDAPTITSVKSLNGRCEAKVSFTNVALDLFSVQVKYSKNPVNVGVPCNLWTDDVGVTPSQNAYGQQSGTLTFMVEHLENDVTYAFCAEADDYLQNISAPSDTVLGQPRFECDLFGCYPGPLKTGYCGQTAAPQVWLATTAAGLVRAGLRARKRSHARRAP